LTVKRLIKYRERNRVGVFGIADLEELFLYKRADVSGDQPGLARPGEFERKADPMSEHYVCFVPMKANFIPNGAARDAAIAILRKAWPRAREITSETSDYVVFRDCGENLESVRCPHCDTTLDIDLWQDRMDDDFSEERGFRLDALPMPCCGVTSTLNELRYD